MFKKQFAVALASVCLSVSVFAEDSHGHGGLPILGSRIH